MYKELSIGDLTTLFKGGVFIHKKTPVFVTGVTEDHTLIISDLKTEKNRKEICPDDESLSTKPVSLGLCNENGDVFWVERGPARVYNLGLCQQNVVTHNINKGYSIDNQVKIARLRKCEGLVDCILDKYPSLENAMGLVQNKEVKAIAFHKLFAFNKDFELVFKDKKVGMVNPDNGKPIFFPGKSYLKSIWELNEV